MTAPALATGQLAPKLTLRRREIAKVLGVGLGKVDRLIQSEAFPSFMIGGTRLARYDDVKAYVDRLAGRDAHGDAYGTDPSP